MKTISIEQEEVSQLLEIEARVDQCHKQIGLLREKEAFLLSRLIQMRQRAVEWEAGVGAKYKLPQGIHWNLDPKSKVLSYETEEDKKAGEADLAPPAEKVESTKS